MKLTSNSHITAIRIIRSNKRLQDRIDKLLQMVLIYKENLL